MTDRLASFSSLRNMRISEVKTTSEMFSSSNRKSEFIVHFRIPIMYRIKGVPSILDFAKRNIMLLKAN